MARDVATVREWMRKAHNDLRTARLALAAEPPILDTGCFHCQQAVEKVLKGVLLWHGVRFPKVHTLGLLFDLAQQKDDALEELRDRCEWLTRFAVQPRYPHGRDPTHDKAREALVSAELAYEFVMKRLTPEARP